MPIYEYRCAKCRRKFSVFFRSFSTEVQPVCPRCGDSDVARLVSRVSVLKSEESRLESMADDTSLLSGLDEDDPKSVARWARKMSREFGEDMGPEFDEAVDRIEAGEDPEAVMGDDDGGSDDGGEPEL